MSEEAIAINRSTRVVRTEHTDGTIELKVFTSKGSTIYLWIESASAIEMDSADSVQLTADDMIEISDAVLKECTAISRI